MVKAALPFGFTHDVHDDAQQPAGEGDQPSGVAAVNEHQREDSERYWSGCSPDPSRPSTSTAPSSASTVVARPGHRHHHRVSPGQLEHGMTVLRRANPQHPHFVAALVENEL